MATTGTSDIARQAQQTTGSDQPARDHDDATGGIGQTLRDATYQKLADQKTRASETLGSVAGAVRGMTEPLRDGGQSGIADYVNKAANGIDRWADQLRDSDVDDAVRAVHDFARRQPALFLGLAFGAGALLARFLKSSTAGNERSLSAASGERWGGGPASGRRRSASGLSDRAARGGTSGVSTTPASAPQTGTIAGDTPRVSPDMPSGRGVL